MGVFYKSGNHKAVCVQGDTEIIEDRKDFKKFYNIFCNKFARVRKDPWTEKEASFLKIIPKNKVGWELN